jgi:6-phosphogluconolactonase
LNAAGSVFPTGIGPYSVTVAPSGKFAFVAASNEPGVWAHSINATTGALTKVLGSPFTAGAGRGQAMIPVLRHY